jgi:septal ring factor EnvC (AmiA/AmiB activator)
MALMLAKTYAAFKAAGVDDDQAEAAAEELASFEGRFSSIETSISHLDAKLTNVEGRVIAIEGKITGIEGKLATIDGKIAGIDGKIAGIEGKFSVLLWAVGINAAATIAILGVLLHHG